MRVLHVVAAYPSPGDPHSGSFVASQVESLRRRGIDVDVSVLTGHGISKYVRGVAVVRRALRSKRYDLVHAHYMYAGWSARIATTKPLIVSFMGNDVIGDSNERGEYSFWNVFFHRSLSIILANTVELSIVKSKQIGGLIRTDRKIVIPNGVDLGFFAPQKVSRSKLGLDSRRFYVLFSGRKTDPVKQYRLAELAVEELISRGVNAELIGLEGKSSAVVRDYLNAVDCLLVTSTHEGSPNSVKEAMACNLPIVSVDVGDVAERIIGADLCFVVNRDVPAIAAGLMKVREGRRKSSNARKLVEPLEIDKISRDIADVYSRVLKGN